MLRAGFENRGKPPRAKAPDTSGPVATDVVSQFANRQTTPLQQTGAALPNTTSTQTTAPQAGAIKPAQTAGQAVNADANGVALTPQAEAIQKPGAMDDREANPAKPTPTGAPTQAPPPVAGPSGFVGFDQYFGANAGAAKNQAQQFQSQLKGQAGAAQNALAQQYSQWNALGAQQPFAASGHVNDQFARAQATRNAGQSVEGLQGAQGGSALDAALTYESGVDTSPYAALDTAIGDTTTRANEERRMANEARARDEAAIRAKADAEAARKAEAKRRADEANRREVERANSVARTYEAASPVANPIYDALFGAPTEAAPASGNGGQGATKRRSNEKEK